MNVDQVKASTFKDISTFLCKEQDGSKLLLMRSSGNCSIRNNNFHHLYIYISNISIFSGVCSANNCSPQMAMYSPANLNILHAFKNFIKISSITMIIKICIAVCVCLLSAPNVSIAAEIFQLTAATNIIHSKYVQKFL